MDSGCAGIFFFSSCTCTRKEHTCVKRTRVVLRNSDNMVVDWMQLCQTNPEYTHTEYGQCSLGCCYKLHHSHTVLTVCTRERMGYSQCFTRQWIDYSQCVHIWSGTLAPPGERTALDVCPPHPGMTYTRNGNCHMVQLVNMMSKAMVT